MSEREFFDQISSGDCADAQRPWTGAAASPLNSHLAGRAAPAATCGVGGDAASHPEQPTPPHPHLPPMRGEGIERGGQPSGTADVEAQCGRRSERPAAPPGPGLAGPRYDPIPGGTALTPGCGAGDVNDAGRREHPPHPWDPGLGQPAQNEGARRPYGPSRPEWEQRPSPNTPVQSRPPLDVPAGDPGVSPGAAPTPSPRNESGTPVDDDGDSGEEAPPATHERLGPLPASPDGDPANELAWGQGPFTSGAAVGAWNLQEQLRPSELIESKKIPPSRGWRRWVYVATFKGINLGESPDERRVRELTELIDSPLRGTYTVAVLGGKGGAGKTTVTAAIGSTFACLRGDKVVAMDADPAQAANLAARIDPRATSSVHDVNSDPRLVGYADIRSHVGKNKATLDVLASARHICSGAALDHAVFAKAHQRMQRFYSVLLIDCGVDLQHPVMAGVLGRADGIVVVASAVVDGAVGADAALRWLHHAGYNQLLSRVVLVINKIRPATGRDDRKQTDRLVAAMTEHFSRIVKPERIFVMPFDRHIATAGVVELDELAPGTRRRFLEVTAGVAGGFAATTDGS